MILIDAIHHSIRRGTVEKEAIYVVMALKKDFSREILGLDFLPTESASEWTAVLQDLTHRGVQRVGLVLSDELSGIETAVEARRILYTTNWIERCNKEIRKITRHVNSFPTPNAALNLVFMILKRLGNSTYDKPITFFITYQLFLEQLLHDLQTHNA